MITKSAILSVYDHKSQKITSREFVDFGITDAKGRAIGAVVVRLEVDFLPHDGNGDSGYTEAPGHYLLSYIQATRDGKTFGAVQNKIIFPSDCAREAYIAERLDGMRKRYAKVAA